MSHKFRISALIFLFIVAILLGIFLYVGILSRRSQLNHSNTTKPNLEKSVTEVKPSPSKEKPGKQDFAISSEVHELIAEEQEKDADSMVKRLNRLSKLPPVRDKAKALFTRVPRYGHFDISLSENGQYATFTEWQSADGKKSAIMVYSFKDDRYINITENFASSGVMHPSISPDGRNVAFRDIDAGIWIVDLKTKSPTLIIDNPTAHKPSFSPDGQYLIYNVSDDTGYRVGFQVYSLDQKRVVKSHFGDEDSSVFHASLSLDGKNLLYKQVRHIDDRYERSLILESFDTGEKQTVRIPHQEFGYARMSPNGKYISYSAVDTTTKSEEVFCFNPKDQTTTRITSGNGQLPFWVGSQRLAFMSARERGVPGIYVIDIDSKLEN